MPAPKSRQPESMKHAALLFAVTFFVAPATSTSAQSRPTESRPAPTQKIKWPDDEERVVCVVDDVEYTVGDLVDHLEENHWPGLREFLELPAGRLYFESPLPARWVRQFADIIALRAAAEYRRIPPTESRRELEAALKRGFERWLEIYTAERAKAGHPIELDQQTINTLLSRFQSEFGLETEVGGWLSVLVPVTPLEEYGTLRTWYGRNPEPFGGRVTISNILIRNRDPRTGEHFVGEKRRRFLERLADVESRLAEDGSNFEEVARLRSEDQITAADGGILRGVKRFDERLPAVLCRKAWLARNGEVVGPFESPYGVHFIKRIGFEQESYVLYNEKLLPEIQQYKELADREDMLFAVRELHGVELRY